MSSSKRRRLLLSGRTSEFDSRVTLFEPSPKRVKLVEDENKGDDEEEEEEEEPAKLVKPKPKPKPPKRIPQTLKTPHPAPERWKQAYDAIKAMRSSSSAVGAPVDSMGCQMAQLGEDDPKNRRYATLVSLMLSSQTKDEITHGAIAQLRSLFGGRGRGDSSSSNSISLAAMLDTPEDEIAQAISKVGFWRKKASYLKQTALKLRDDFGSDVPRTVDELCSLPGVGPKMAFLTLQTAWNLNEGIGVDVHVHRITNRLGWHAPPTKNPEQTRLNLQSWLPKPLHQEINQLMVGFGQVVCLPVRPRCDLCDLGSSSDGPLLCPSARNFLKVAKTTKKRSRKEIVVSSSSSSSKHEMKVGPEVEIAFEEEEVGDLSPS